MRLVWATVTSLESTFPDVQQLGVELDGGAVGVATCYTRLSGACLPGDRVLLNTTAVDLALGTGGKHFVVARAGSLQGVALEEPADGHIMKMRYTPMQLDVLSVESQESPHHATMKTAETLDGTPVVCCGLHSQVPLVAAAVKAAEPQLRVAYCMTDVAALAMPVSDLVRECVSAGLLDATVTCGQAFGGELEAVNLHSGMLAAKHVAKADVIVVAIGPGVVGTATPFGHGGIAQGEAINAVAALEGTPVACLRMSFADKRPRHQGVSHHSLAALSKVALAPAQVAVPSLPAPLAEKIEAALLDSGVWERHVRADASAGSVPPPSTRGVVVRSMGRGLVDDPAFFAAAFAAGEVAARVRMGR